MDPQAIIITIAAPNHPLPNEPRNLTMAADMVIRENLRIRGMESMEGIAVFPIRACHLLQNLDKPPMPGERFLGYTSCPFSLGRSYDCQFVLPPMRGKVFENHFMLELVASGLTCKDLASSDSGHGLLVDSNMMKHSTIVSGLNFELTFDKLTFSLEICRGNLRRLHELLTTQHPSETSWVPPLTAPSPVSTGLEFCMQQSTSSCHSDTDREPSHDTSVWDLQRLHKHWVIPILHRTPSLFFHLPHVLTFNFNMQDFSNTSYTGDTPPSDFVTADYELKNLYGPRVRIEYARTNYGIFAKLHSHLHHLSPYYRPCTGYSDVIRQTEDQMKNEDKPFPWNLCHPKAKGTFYHVAKWRGHFSAFAPDMRVDVEDMLEAFEEVRQGNKPSKFNSDVAQVSATRTDYENLKLCEGEHSEVAYIGPSSRYAFPHGLLHYDGFTKVLLESFNKPKRVRLKKLIGRSIVGPKPASHITRLSGYGHPTGSYIKLADALHFCKLEKVIRYLKSEKRCKEVAASLEAKLGSRSA